MRRQDLHLRLGLMRPREFTYDSTPLHLVLRTGFEPAHREFRSPRSAIELPKQSPSWWGQEKLSSYFLSSEKTLHLKQ